MRPGDGDRRGRRATCAWLAGLMAAEFLLFDRVGAHWHTRVYPRWNDQIQYLTEAYTGYMYMLARGFWAGLWNTITHPAAQGTLDDCYAVLLFRLVGPSRSAALAVNLIAFLAWQGTLFMAVARGTGSRALAWISAAVLLSLAGPWSAGPGSAVDFRLDHLAMCSMGVTLAAALLTDRFRATGWSLLFGVAAGITLSTRFLTGPYFILIFAALLAWVAASPGPGRRWRNFALAALIALALAVPLVWLNWTWVYNYYWIGHFFGPESAIRNPHLNLVQSIAFVVGHFSGDHLGAACGGLATLVFGCLGTWAVVARRRAPEAVRSPGSEWPRQAGMLGAIFLLSPGIVLTLHNLKSPIVEDIMTPGLVVLLLAAWAALLDYSRRRLPALAAGRPLAGLVAAALLLGGGYFVARQVSRPFPEEFIADARKVNALADGIYLRSRAAQLDQPRVGVDEVTDCLDGQVLRVICYERHRVWVPFVMTLPTGIGEEKESVLMDHLAQSDFVFLTTDGPVGAWPYDKEMRALRPVTQAWCEAHLYPVDRFGLLGQRMVLYQRREIPLPLAGP
jgi:hypothetical protein